MSRKPGKHGVLYVCALAVAVAAAAVFAGAARSAAAPQLSTKLVGTWSRQLTQSDVTKGKPEIPAALLVGTKCKLSLKATGAAHLDCGKLLGDFNGSVTPTGATNLRIDVGDGRPNTYRWRVAGSVLTLTKVTDPSGNRITIFGGAWHRG